ncbi:hypothetical protein [Pseudomonas sp. H9]|uniref:hypothetical protein n=1 Tax=Pseudomonas sp. H9 TaxID=483968 RepID=UPI0010578C41|nr:hypothetical protein [Pseudomonas sp. H9]TDF78540.1 hypothetical protein E1573_22815 [Pseudomonas sp. H9]
MKVIEPISSALLLTGCIYAAGVSQNNSFMRSFGVNPEFSQPSIDKIFYDGGLITFEIFYNHLIYAFWFITTFFGVITTALLIFLLIKGSQSLIEPYNQTKPIFSFCCSLIPTGTLILTYIIFLSFSSFQKGQTDGVKLSQIFIERCHWIEITQDSKSERACAFRKDKDSIWYYKINSDGIKINSKLLSSANEITYMEPEKP